MNKFGPSLLLGMVLIVVGCQRRGFDGPTVDAFQGHVLSQGKPVRFAADERAKLILIHKGSSDRFNIPLEADGTFTIGWMPTGEYLGSLDISKGDPAKPWEIGSNQKQIPPGFRIEDGRTEYEIEVGKL